MIVKNHARRLCGSTPIADAHPVEAFHPRKLVHEAFLAIVTILYRLKPGSSPAQKAGCACTPPLIDRPGAKRTINGACLLHSVHPGVMARRLGFA